MRKWLQSIQAKPAAPFVTAIVTTVLLGLIAAVIVQGETDVVAARPALEPAPFLPAVDLLVIVAILVPAWGLTVGHRCTDAYITRNVRVIVLLMVLWLVLAIAKVSIVDPHAKTILWYAQSVPLLFIPLLFFFCVLRTSSLDARPGIVLLKRVLVGIGIGLSLLALSNNLHDFVFVLDPNDANWELTFEYGLGYYPCIVIMMLSMVVSVTLLGITSHRKIRWRIVWVAVLFGLGIAYWVVVLTRGWGMQPGNNALAGCMLYVAAIEFCFDLGFFPAAHRIFSLFRNMPFDLKILTPAGGVAYRTAVARTLDATTIARLVARAEAEAGDAPLAVRSEATPGLIFKLYRLSAGIALLTENSSEIDRLQEQLEERRRDLANQNEVLGRSRDMQSLLFRQQRERELGERVEHDLASAAQQIGLILDNRVSGDDEAHRAERIQQLNLVKVLVAYCKRKGMLALASAESDTVTAEQVSLIAREAMADLHSVGIECAVLVGVRGPISMAALNTVYDSFYDCILAVLPQVDPVIMTFVSLNDNDELEMRATIECAIGIDAENAVEQIPAIATSTESWTAVQMSIAHDLEERFRERGSSFTVGLEDGLVVAVVRAPAGSAPQAGGAV